jgi:hypothetical protein
MPSETFEDPRTPVRPQQVLVRAIAGPLTFDQTISVDADSYGEALAVALMQAAQIAAQQLGFAKTTDAPPTFGEE